jgi:Mrp family chromosome partitioning ATPase
MERIKRALALAKAERDAARAPVPAVPAARIAVVPEPVASVTVDEELPPEHHDTTGRFLRSREVPVDHEHLRRERILLPGLAAAVVGGGATAVQSYKMLRTQVMQRMRARGWTTLAVMSPTPGDGKTLTAINLAISISADPGHSALLVDFDLRQPAVARRLGLDQAGHPGIEMTLGNQTPVQDVFVRLRGYDRLMLLPANGPAPGSSELLAAEPTRKLVTELKTRYPDRIVIFDLPPILGADDAVAFAPQVDAVLLVLGEGHTRSEDVLRSFELLRDRPVIGTVLNGSRSDASAGYAY